MGDNAEGGVMTREEGLKYAVREDAKGAETLGFSAIDRAPMSARHCARSGSLDLGSPLTIDDVAALLGCSVWTVRQRYLRQGLPHLQARARGKLVFFREQVVAWIQKRQQQKKGGLPR